MIAFRIRLQDRESSETRDSSETRNSKEDRESPETGKVPGPESQKQNSKNSNIDKY